MKKKNNDKSKIMSLKSLKTALRKFAEVEIPETLETKLLAQIPQQKTKIVAGSCYRRHWGFWSFGGAAAAAMVLAVILAAVYMPNSAGGRGELSRASAKYAQADQNVANIQDINTGYFEKR